MANTSRLPLSLWTLTRPKLLPLSCRFSGHFARLSVKRFSAQSTISITHKTIPLISTTTSGAGIPQLNTYSGHRNLDIAVPESPTAYIGLSDTTRSRYNYGSEESNGDFQSQRLGWMALFTVGAVVGTNTWMALDSPVEAATTGEKEKPSPDASEVFLYWASGSPPCWRVMLALEEKGLQNYPNKLLSMDKKEQKSEEVVRLNPRGQLPTFTHKGYAVNESVAAVEYLEAAFKDHGTPLLPSDLKELAMVLQKKYEALLLFSKGIEGHFFYSFKKPEDKTQDEIDNRLKAFQSELNNWENHFKQLGPGRFAAGENFSMADVIFFPTLALMWRLGLNLNKYPNIKDYFERTSQRASIQKTWPPHWRNTPRLKYLENV